MIKEVAKVRAANLELSLILTVKVVTGSKQTDNALLPSYGHKSI